jgi:uncharacterized protein YukE
MSGLEMPSGDPGGLEQLASSLEAAAGGFGELGRSTSQVTTSVRSDADWTGDAADSYTAFAGNLSQGAAAVEVPLSRIALSVRDYAGFLRTAQQKVQAYATAAEVAQVSGNDGGYVSVAQAAEQDAELAIANWQAAGERAATEVNAAAGQLKGLFSASGPVQGWLVRQPMPWDSLAGLSGLSEVPGAGVLKTPGVELDPEILKTPGAQVGPEILLTPPGELGPEILEDPIFQSGSEILKTPPGELGPLFNYSDHADEGGYQPAGDAGIFSREEIAWLVYQHVGGGDNPLRPSLSEIEDALNNGQPVRREGQQSVWIDYRGVRVIVNERMPARSTSYYLGR